MPSRAGATPGLYAILPQLRDGFAPNDPQEFAERSPAGGQHLSIGCAGLAAGVYPLLPARYALLPGATLVPAFPGTTDAVAGVNDATGRRHAGHRGLSHLRGGGTRDARFSGFTLRPGSYGRPLAAYADLARDDVRPAEARPVAPDDAGG